MLFSVDLWHKGWGFGFTIVIWEEYEDLLQLLGFQAQIKAGNDHSLTVEKYINKVENDERS